MPEVEPMTAQHDRIGFLSKETFMDMPDKEKWGVWFDYMVGNRADQKERCAECVEDFDVRYEKKRSQWWTAGYLTVLAVSGAVGGFLAQVMGFPKLPDIK